MKLKTFDIIYAIFIIILISMFVGTISYNIGYKDGQINAINGQIDYEIVYDSTYKQLKP